MGDNSTSTSAADFDGHVGSVNPYYRFYHEEALGLVMTVNPTPATWLDTGSGTGTMALLAAQRLPETVFTLADPSCAMLDIAAEKLVGFAVETIMKTTQRLDLPDCTFDVITAIQAHHYLDEATRKTAAENCFRMLKPGGVFVTFENIRTFSDIGIKIGLERWGRYQAGAGRSSAVITNHLSRFDKEYFPITVQQHLKLLKDVGFGVVEMLFYGMMQAGFYAIK